MTVRTSFPWRACLVLLTAACVAGAVGCGKKNQGAKSQSEVDAKLEEIVKGLQTEKQPYKGNLTPKKAAEITHEVSMQSLRDFPSGKDLPKDPKKLMEINEQIRANSEKIYGKYGTSMNEMMRYLSDLSPKDREIYNNRLTELFLEQSKKKYGAQEGEPAAPAATPEATAAPAPKR
ncbi:MAG: hypothetical protein AB1439_05740 [candidate division FCPU426 bacterium]